jgi:beta-glucuronidase
MDGHGGWKLDVATKVDRGALEGKAEVAYSLLDKSGAVVWKQPAQPVEFAGMDGESRSAAVLAKVQAWSPEHPALYTLVTTVTSGKQVDETKVRIGFRQIEAKGAKILLNGEPVTIRGFSRHQFLAGKGMSLSVAEDRRDIEDLKALGANFVRLAHYTQSQDVYDACDELGLMVWTEIPAWQTSAGSLGSARVWANAAEPQLRGMVEQHRNHPSVVIWSVANEIPSDKPEVAAFVAKAIAYVKGLDSSRLVTFASNRREQDKALGAVDVIAVNEYFGWYYGKQEDVGPTLDQMHKLYPDKPLLVSEFGSEAVAGWTPPTPPAHSRDYSEAVQVSFLETHMEQIYAPERRGFVAGAVIWCYNDFPDPGRFGGDHPAMALYRNNKGIVRMDRSHKPAYETVKAFFGKLAALK